MESEIQEAFDNVMKTINNSCVTYGEGVEVSPVTIRNNDPTITDGDTGEMLKELVLFQIEYKDKENKTPISKAAKTTFDNLSDEEIDKETKNKKFVLTNEPLFDENGEFLCFLEAPLKFVLSDDYKYGPITEKDLLKYKEGMIKFLREKIGKSDKIKQKRVKEWPDPPKSEEQIKGYEEDKSNCINSKKVYCKDCEYYKEYARYEFCKSPENLEDSYRNKNMDYKYNPCEKNEDNHCEWFKRKGMGKKWYKPWTWFK